MGRDVSGDEIVTFELDDPASLVLDGGAADLEDVPELPVSEQSPLQALAFTIWALEAGKDVGLTQQIVEKRTGLRVSVEQIRRWRRENRWAENVGSVNHALVESRSTVLATLTYGTVRAASRLVGILNDANATNNEVIKAASTILDRAGFPVMLRGELFQGLVIPEAEDGLDSDLDAEWRSYDPVNGDVVSPDPITSRHGNLAGIDRINETQIRATVGQSISSHH